MVLRLVQELMVKPFQLCIVVLKNSCEYIAKELFDVDLATESACICDDDNDIEMALACRHAFVPTITSQTMAATIEQNAHQFTAIRGVDDTAATERALEELLNRLIAEDETSV